ncbi:MAG TPA: prolyl oligopeptidase family serine peptidase [Terriglobia bacterium]|nr:prolyl oligopeptidase family serine peptidase [Terriglobia bacterium]
MSKESSSTFTPGLGSMLGRTFMESDWGGRMHSTSKRRLAQIAILSLLGSAPALAAQAPFTLEQVMSSPFPTELLAAPKGAKFAWVFNSADARNIWVAEPAEGGRYRSRQLTPYTQDDGQDLAELVWTPDAGAIVYARGGDFENGRTYPNPAAEPAGVEQDVWVVSLDGSAPRKLGEGHSPAVSPQGDAVAYIFKDQVWLTHLAYGSKPEQLIHDQGRSGSLRWSPDGARLAFVTSRGDHGFVAVYNLAAKTLVYLDPSVDRDVDPVWSPDGRSIAFLRFPAVRDELIFEPRRTGQPWSIRVADASTGTGREVWHADPGRGSVFHGIEAENQLFWTAGGHLVFPWERDGWTHLYSVPLGGGAARLLTPGEFEVEFVSLSPDRNELLFASNQDDIDRRHLWREAVTADRPTALTRGTGIEWSPVMGSDGTTVALLHSDAQHPARPATLDASGGMVDLAPESMPSDFPAAALVTPQQVILTAADGMRIHGQLFLPKDDGDGQRHPALVFFHGGSRREMLLGWHYMGYYHNAYAMNQYLASRGYVVLSVNYRSGIGYGLDFREALNYGAAGASEFNDVEGAGLYLRGRADVDPARIGLWGGSYGGYLTALGLARASDLFACGVDMHGVHDWNLEIPNWRPAYNPESRPDVARLAFESSPLASVKTWRSPVLLIQGDDDRNVPFAEMVQLVAALRQQGVEFKQLVFPDEIHDFLRHHTWLAAYHAGSDFFDAHLKK